MTHEYNCTAVKKELPYQPVVILVETTESTAAQIEKLNIFLDQMKARHELLPQLELCVIALHPYGADVVQAFCPLNTLESITVPEELLMEDGHINTMAGMGLVVSMLCEKEKTYCSEHKIYDRPKVYLIAEKEIVEAEGSESPAAILGFYAEMMEMVMPKFYTYAFTGDEFGIPFWVEWTMVSSPEWSDKEAEAITPEWFIEGLKEVGYDKL